MKITRFTQSCLLVEQNSSRILIDPSGDEAGNDFGKLDAVLYTHEHADHFNAPVAIKLRKQGAILYANHATSQLISGDVKIVHDREEFEIGGIKIKVLELPHCPMPNGAEGPQNTGYLINKTFFDPGDGKELEGLRVENLAWPITGPDISPRDAFDFAKQLSAKTLIPVHYDRLGAKPEMMEWFNENFKFGFKIHTLKHGESLEI